VPPGRLIAVSPEHNQAMQRLAEAAEPVDLIFTDIHSSRMDGFAFMETCRERYRDKYGDIIIVTDRENKEEIQRGI